MILTDLSLPENHLWQSTLCVVAVWLLTFALKKNRAAIRYWLWFAASVKFLIPFSLFVSIGNRFGWSTAPVTTQPQWSALIAEVGHPFAAATPGVAAVLPPASHSISAIPAVLFGVWLCGFAVSLTSWIRSWRNMRSLQHEATPLPLDLPVRAMSSPSLVEPGVFGIFRPVLLLPEGITDRLTPAQLSAVAAHEMCHVRRRDNLTAAIHMAVEAVFWFHPLLRWIRTRLVEERERACDEEVLRIGSEPDVYAEGILSICKFYVEASPTCASGISGSDLKKRIVRIMAERLPDKLSFSRKLLMTVIGIAAAAGPVVFGIVNAPQLAARSQTTSEALPSFEVASIKPNPSGTPMRFFQFSDPSRFRTTNIPAKDLIEFAYHLQPFQISGGPGWIGSQGYDIEAKVDDSTAAALQKLPREERMDQFRLMLRSLLADRFKLKVSHETKELPVFALVIGKGGPKLTPASAPSTQPAGANAPGGQRGPGIMMSPGGIKGRGMPIHTFAEVLARQPELGGRLVLDQTGIKGNYDFTLEWAAERPEPLPGTAGRDQAAGNAPPVDSSGPSIFTAIQEQLGLKLESTKGPVDMLVIDNIEKPSEN
jgi:bla regulator protein blaR1